VVEVLLDANEPRLDEADFSPFFFTFSSAAGLCGRIPLVVVGTLSGVPLQKGTFGG